MNRTLHMTTLNKILLLIVAVMFAGAWFAFIQILRSNPVEDMQVLSIVITLVGLFFSILNKEIGSRVFRSMSNARFSFGIPFGEILSEGNTQKLYLIVGTITAVAGVIIVVLSFYLKIEAASGKI